MKQMIKKIFLRITATLMNIFISGLLTVLPLAITVALFNVSFKLVKSWLEPISALHIPLIEWIPHHEIIIVILGIFIIGIILKILILNTIIRRIEYIIGKMPLIKYFYNGIKQLITALSPQDQVTFKQVVILEFPLSGIYSIGFLTSELPVVLAPSQQEKYFNVFIPTTPNPTSGFFVIVPESKFSVSLLTRQEAMALIISGGIIRPERFIEKDVYEKN